VTWADACLLLAESVPGVRTDATGASHSYASAAAAGLCDRTLGIYNEDGNANGDAGTQVGTVAIVVTQPGAPLLMEPNPCGEPGTAIAVAVGQEESPQYCMAVGCLDRGKITWGSGQNQQ
jgi:hypothetical protein